MKDYVIRDVTRMPNLFSYLCLGLLVIIAIAMQIFVHEPPHLPSPPWSPPPITLGESEAKGCLHSNNYIDTKLNSTS